MADVPDAQTRIILRPIGSPLPLGFFAFAVGIAMTSLLSLDVFPQQDARQVAVILVAFTGPLEALAAVFAFLGRDVGSGTAFSILGGSWVLTGLSMLSAAPGARSPVLSAFDFVLALILLLLAGSAIAGKPALGMLLVASGVRFVLSGLQQLSGQVTLAHWSGIIGLVIAAVGLYGGLATIPEDSRGRLVLPTGRRGRARESLEEGLDAQLAGVQSEAGVRNQL
jgi:succinate-acetate transporter protein